jgi:hypothetical protein
MKQAIAGVAPQELGEVTVMTVWPSIAAYPSGRFLGRLYSIEAGFYFFTVGNLLALASIPHALALYFYRLLPSFFGLQLHGTCYKITNRRVVELRNEVNFRASRTLPLPCFQFEVETKSVSLDRFDTVKLVRQPGQAWFDAGDLHFFQGDIETFLLVGVSRPEAFLQTCIKSQRAYVGVQQALKREAVSA